MKGLSPDGIVKPISFALSKTSSLFQIHHLHVIKYCCTSFPELMSSKVGRIYWSFFTISVCLVLSWQEHVCYFSWKVSETQHFPGAGKHWAPFFSDILPNRSFTFHLFWRLVSSGSLRRHWNTDHSQLSDVIDTTSSLCRPYTISLFVVQIWGGYFCWTTYAEVKEHETPASVKRTKRLLFSLDYFHILCQNIRLGYIFF